MTPNWRKLPEINKWVGIQTWPSFGKSHVFSLFFRLYGAYFGGILVLNPLLYMQDATHSIFLDV